VPRNTAHASQKRRPIAGIVIDSVENDAGGEVTSDKCGVIWRSDML